MRDYKRKKKDLTEILYGIHPVTEALLARRREIFAIYTASEEDNPRVEKSLDLARLLNIPIKKVSAENLKFLTKTEHHQLLAAKTSPFPFSKIDELYEYGKKNFLVLLDNITDIHNLGAIIRTALCAGTGGIIIPKDRSAMPNPTVSKISAGALEYIKIAIVANLAGAIKTLKKKDIWIAGLDAEGEYSLFETKFQESSAIVIGGEEKGLRPVIKKECDFTVSIPLTGQINSLNASVAGAVVMYEICRQKTL